jgi:hypothetical protein
MAVNDWYEITTDMTVQGEHVYNVMNFRETVECAEDVPAQQLCNGFDAAISAAWAALLAELTVINCFYCRRISPTPSVAFTKIKNLQGDVAADPLPSASALLVSWYGLTASARHRGRTYFAGVPEDIQSGGLLENAAITDWQTFANLLLVPVAGAGSGTWEFGIWSRASIAGVDAKVAVVRSNMATMRSRRQRPGAA